MAFLIEVIPMLIEGLPAIIEAVGSALGIVSDVVAGEATVVEGEATVAVGLKVVAAGLGGAAAGIGVGKLVAEKDAKEEVAASTAAVAVAAAAETFKLMKAAEAAKEAAEKAMAAEAAVWKEAMLETKAGLEEALKSEAEALIVVERGPRSRRVVRLPIIESGLKSALQKLNAKAKVLLIELERLVEGGVPTVYLKILAGLLVTLNAVGIKLVHIAINYTVLSGSNQMNVAKEAKEIVDELHERVGKLTEDSPSMVKTNDETHEQLMNMLFDHLDSTKQEIQKLKEQLESMEFLTKGIPTGIKKVTS